MKVFKQCEQEMLPTIEEIQVIEEGGYPYKGLSI